tara:strand:+ start:1161 stop:1427 length:267 start_codon:yes stop_codon:yes gene_type:complete
MITREVNPKQPTMEKAKYARVFAEDLVEIACLCYAANAQDSPNPKQFYLDQILNRAFAYLTPDQRQQVDEYLAEKKYLAPVEIILEAN